MGSDYHEFRGRGFWADDSLVALWYACLFEQGQRNDATQVGWLDEEMKSWKLEACVCPTGLSFANPNEAWSNEQVLRVLALARLAVVSLSDGGVFKRDELESWRLEGDRVCEGIVWLRDLDKELVRQVGAAFCSLLDGSFPPKPPFASAWVGTERGFRWIQSREGEPDLGITLAQWRDIWTGLNTAHESAGGEHWNRTPPDLDCSI